MASSCSEVLGTPPSSVLCGVMARAKRLKETTYPELVGRHARARLVVMGVEVGGRFSTETQSFVSHLARAKARCETSLRKKMPAPQHVLLLPAFLELPCARGADGDTRRCVSNK